MKQGAILFSIIIPTFNRPEQLTQICLPSLAKLDYPCDRFEVIIVHDGDEKISQLEESFGEFFHLKIVAQPHAGPAVARNTGAELARGQFLAFTDDDCAPTAAWLSAFARRFATAPDCAIGGRTKNALVENPYSATCQLLVDYLYDRFNSNPNRMRFFTSNNLALPARHFHAIGGFSEIFSIGGEDRELCYRWTQSGSRLIYAPEAEVFHWHHMSLATFVRQHFRYGMGAFTFRKILADLKAAPMKLEPPAFYLGLLHYALSQENGQSKISRTLLTGCSQLAIAAGYLWKWLSWSCR